MTWYGVAVKSMEISQFKAQCIATMKEVQRTHEPVMVTHWGHPIVRIEPVCDNPQPRKFGAMREQMRVNGDIVHSDFDKDISTTGVLQNTEN